MFCYGLNGFGAFNKMQSAWPWILGANIFKLIFIGLILFFIVKLILNHKTSPQYATNHHAIEILQQRYAKGELSEEEYKQRIKILEK